jgi:hypothetical protein
VIKAAIFSNDYDHVLDWGVSYAADCGSCSRSRSRQWSTDRELKKGKRTQSNAHAIEGVRRNIL